MKAFMSDYKARHFWFGEHYTIPNCAFSADEAIAEAKRVLEVSEPEVERSEYLGLTSSDFAGKKILAESIANFLDSGKEDTLTLG